VSEDHPSILEAYRLFARSRASALDAEIVRRGERARSRVRARLNGETMSATNAIKDGGMKLAALVARAVTQWSPWPIVAVLRLIVGGSQRGGRGKRGASEWEFHDQRYGTDAAELLDVYLPRTPSQEEQPFGTVIWVHGGSFVSGHKDDQAPYFRDLAASGCAVVSVEYSRAPETRFPIPVRQVIAAIGYLTANAAGFGLDPSRMVLAGDSAGANICAQVALCATNTHYASLLGVDFVGEPPVVKGLVLCCGVLDMTLLPRTRPVDELLVPVVDAVGWAYSGVRHFRDDDYFVAAMSLSNFLVPDFPPTFLTVGNVDPLRSQSETFAERLLAIGVDVDAVFYDESYEPPLGHEYQFDLDSREGRTALSRITAFCKRIFDT